MTNIVHTIDPDLVQTSVDKKIDHLKKLCNERVEIAVAAIRKYEKDPTPFEKHGLPRPENPELIKTGFNKMIKKELEYYALARVVELPQKGKRFILVYGDEDNETVTSGTGPFISYDKAEGWFTTQGR